MKNTAEKQKYVYHIPKVLADPDNSEDHIFTGFYSFLFICRSNVICMVYSHSLFILLSIQGPRRQEKAVAQKISKRLGQDSYQESNIQTLEEANANGC